MRPLPVTAMGCASALGTGVEATAAALRERRGGLRPNDLPGMEGVGHVGRAEAADATAMPAGLAPFDCRNNRLALAAATSDGLADAVAQARARWGAARVAVLIGTSTSGIAALEDAYRARTDAGILPNFPFRETHDVFSPARLLRALFRLEGPALVISTACSSAANSAALAADWIEAGLVDAAVVGGADSLCRTTLRGFQSLDLVSPEPCRPCGADRKGISIGEAAAFFLVERVAPAGHDGLALLGCGASCDAHHMSTPHPEGVGARLAMTRALESAGLAPDAIDYVNFHGTGTPFNDTVEDLAVHAVLGDRVPCSSTKGWTGHTLGTAGAIEAVVAAIAIREGLLPGCLGLAAVDPALRCHILADNQPMPVRRVLSNSFGFGGNNCTLILGSVP